MAVYDPEKTEQNNPIGTSFDPASLRDREAAAVAHSDQAGAAQRDQEIGALQSAYNAPSATAAQMPKNHPSNKGGGDTVGKGYTDESGDDGVAAEPKKGKITNLRGRINRRKALLGAGLVGLGGGGILGFFAVLQGPMMPVHLAQILGKNDSDAKIITAARVDKMLRYYKTGDIAETRLSKLGSVRLEKLRPQLAAIGIEIDNNKLTIDPKKDPNTKGLPRSEQKKALAAKHGIPEKDIRSRVNGKFEIEFKDLKTGQMRSIVKNVAKDIDGKVPTYMNTRLMAKYINAPGIFSPKRAIADQERKFMRTADGRKQFIQDDYKSSVKQSAAALESKGKLRSKLQGNETKISAALLGSAALCVVRSAADDAVAANRGLIVEPGMAHAYKKMAFGSGTQASMMPAAQVGAEKESLFDEDGKSVFDSKPMQATANPHKVPEGEEIKPEYQQAFSNDTTADNIKADLDKGGVSDALCSTPGQIIQLGAGLALIAAGPFTGGGSWAAFAAKQGAGAAATAGVLYFVQTQLAAIMSDKNPIPDVLSGPTGGSILAYSAREGANTARRAQGAIRLTQAQENNLNAAIEAEDQKEFGEKSYYARMFDYTDHRSLVGRAIDSQDRNVSNKVSGIASLFTQPSKLFSPLASIFTPKTMAAERNYDWGFEKYSIPLSIVNDPALADPYENANKVAALLDGGNTGYIDKAMNCFGVSISKDSGVWNVVPEKPINPNDDAYGDANCADTNDQNWKRIMLFVFDTRTMAAMACFEDDDAQACQDTGIVNVASNAGEPINNSAGDGDMKKTVKVTTPGEFITMPKRYSCEGRTTEVDSRIAPALAYMLLKYNMCADDGRADGHRSHGAGLGVDIEPRDNKMSKEEWEKTVEAAARDMGWVGDGAKDAKGSKQGCASYSGYGQCVGGVGEIPQWVRWIGYNGDVDHGDPWHVFGTDFAHIHIGWASPNGGDAVASSKIQKPIPAVYTFEAPIPDDLKELL